MQFVPARAGAYRVESLSSDAAIRVLQIQMQHGEDRACDCKPCLHWSFFGCWPLDHTEPNLSW